MIYEIQGRLFLELTTWIAEWRISFTTAMRLLTCSFFRNPKSWIVSFISRLSYQRSLTLVIQRLRYAMLRYFVNASWMMDIGNLEDWLLCFDLSKALALAKRCSRPFSMVWEILVLDLLSCVRLIIASCTCDFDLRNLQRLCDQQNY